MDDFGTGYSSLSYLSKFPLDILKMDRSLLAAGASPVTSGLASAVLGLGETFDLEVVAEGIEYPEQSATLRDLGCETGQGFYFARPMEPARPAHLPGRARRRDRRHGDSRGRQLSPGGSAAMQHSYEGLDRVGGFDRVRLFAPLAHRDYRLLVGGMSVSLLGDGLFLVALAWQVYALSNAPTALASVGIAMTIPTIVCLLLGGAVSDRYDRRMVMLCADAVRALGLATLAFLSVSGALKLWELMAVAVVYGAATAFFDPASDALVPQLLPSDALAQANSLDQLIRPLALRLAGPAVGGVVIGAIGVGWSFGLDAASFVVSAATLLAMSPCAGSPARPSGDGAARRDAARCAGRSPPACATSAATPGCGRRWSARRSPTCCSWGPPRSCCRSWSRTGCRTAPARSASSSPREGSGHCCARSSSASAAFRGAP